MRKYIIEIEEENPFVTADNNELFKAKGFNSLVFDKNGLDKLTPFGECADDCGVCKEYFEKGMNEAWEIAKKVANISYTIAPYQLKDIFSVVDYSAHRSNFYNIAIKLSPQEAKEKIENYEQKSIITVGDEVFCEIDDKRFYAVVTRICNDSINVIYKDGSVSNDELICEWKKTGKHYDLSQILGGNK